MWRLNSQLKQSGIHNDNPTGNPRIIYTESTDHIKCSKTNKKSNGKPEYPRGILNDPKLSASITY